MKNSWCWLPPSQLGWVERPGGGPLEDGGPRHGWECEAEKVEDFFLATSVWPQLPDQDRAMLRSQGGPMAGLPFTCCSTLLHSRFDAQVLRVLLLRRLCGRPLYVLGHHSAACANVECWGRRGFALESAAARVCREAGGRVSANVLVTVGQDQDQERTAGHTITLEAAVVVQILPLGALRRSGGGWPHTCFSRC